MYTIYVNIVSIFLNNETSLINGKTFGWPIMYISHYFEMQLSAGGKAVRT